MEAKLNMLLIFVVIYGTLAACRDNQPNISLLNEPNPRQSSPAIPPETPPIIVHTLEEFINANVEVDRSKAIDDLVNIGPSVIRPLFLLRKDSRFWGTDTLNGMYEVSRRVGEPAIPHLISILKDPTPDPQLQLHQAVFAATEALVQLGEPAIPQLIPLLKDPNEQVRSNATQALKKLGYIP